jgi:hypothetical protein
MTSRERLIAVSRGEAVDRKPVICWPVPTPDSDVEFGSEPKAADKLLLAPVWNPAGNLESRQIDVSALSVEEAEAAIGESVERAKTSIRNSLERGCDGILYILFGAVPGKTTPMQYGGLFLERDREILASADCFRMIYVVGDEGVYLDFVSDLPSEIFAWDSQASGITAQEMRTMRPGALASNDPGADIDLRLGNLGPTQMLEERMAELIEFNAEEGYATV